ncbi:MAG: A/G-specific adenine glycosylase [Pseudolabrys sp.]|nr:A/G-specific adenine glycosylase [Pseudolabrys sp.]
MATLATATARRKQPRPDPAALLAWYDRHRRVLPWRALPGAASDPYAVWLSEIMLQQTTVVAVAPYYAKFLTRWPTVAALAAAPLDDVLKMWAGLGYYARARNLHACARAVVEHHDGRFPSSVERLQSLPGIGAYTSAAIASIAFDQPAVPVDGNVERVVTRLFALDEELPGAKPAIKALAEAIAPAQRHGDFAQALMDLGATICTPKKPACVLCPWQGPCVARRDGTQELFPRKAPKREGRQRRGAAFVVLRGDEVLVRTRPAKGLLGGMTEVPTTEWSATFSEDDALSFSPLKAEWRRRGERVTHVFTHFPLELVVYVARVSARTKVPDGMRFISLRDVPGEAFPNLMRKVLRAAGIHPE